jgi:hypothetical protein
MTARVEIGVPFLFYLKEEYKCSSGKQTNEDGIV